MAERRSKQADAVVGSLNHLADEKTLAGMARYGLPSDRALGVPMNAMLKLAKGFERDHELAAALWATGIYEARTMAALLDEPARVTPAQMDRWARDFDSWGICDTVCFHLFDRTPHALAKVEAWSKRREEFVKRAAFALLACVALHDKAAPEAAFLRSLPWIERGAEDERDLVKKGVSWALRAIGERSRGLHAAAGEMAARFASSESAPVRWIGKTTLRELKRPAVLQRLARRAQSPMR